MNELKALKRKAIVRLGLTAVGTLLVTLMLSVGLAYMEGYRTSEGYKEATRNNLLIGDYRSSMITLRNALDLNIRKIEFRDKANDLKFSLGENVRSIEKWFYLPINHPITLSEQGHPSASLIFYADGMHYIPFTMIIWGMFALVLIPLFAYYLKRLEGQYLIELSENRLKELGRVSRQVAHDLRSPLTALKTLSQKRPWAQQSEQQLFESAIHRINRIADDILNLGIKNSASTPELTRSPTPQENIKTSALSINDLRDLISKVIELKRLEFEDRKTIALKFYPEDINTTTTVLADRTALDRILSNLINNSIESFAPNEVCKISVTTSKVDSEVWIEIRDQGKGIDPDKIQLVTSEGYSEGKTDGHGLGLSYARKTLEKWGGQVSIASQLNQGTTVTLKLRTPQPEANATHNSPN